MPDLLGREKEANMDYRARYQSWLDNQYFDEQTKEELRSISGDEKEIEERFYKDLEFGTGGLRGILGAGTNRMNIYTVRKATQGLANYILRQKPQGASVAIAYDSRHMSPEFSDCAALCLAANGIKAYVFDSLRPTPQLSFAIRELGCTSGIVITASHNPPEYNGYKVYWEDGAQVTSPKDVDIIDCVAAIEDYAQVKTMDKQEAQAAGLYQVIGRELDDAYIEVLKKQILHPESIQAMAESLKIVYTPLCGTGNVPVRRILSELGFRHVYVVPQQEKPDPDFGTLDYPNPEDPKAFALALELAREKDADIVLATDPDADRLGVYVKDSKSGEYIPFTGNMSGMIIAEYLFRERQALGLMPPNPTLVTTIVTTNMTMPIAANYGARLVEVLTGFKFIGEQIKEMEASGSGSYVFGLEESYGCLIGSYARDKDAVSASVALCEAAAYYKTKGKTLWDAMLDMYEKYGYYKDSVKSIGLAGIEGLARIQRIMEHFRKNTPSSIGGFTVLSARDYKSGITVDMKSGITGETGLPSSNVLYYDCNDGAWLCIRPSGTEPKIKFYYGVKGKSMKEAEEMASRLGKELEAIVEAVE